MNKLQEFLQGQEQSTIEDVAKYGIESGAIGSLIYTTDIVKFFDRYYNDIEAVILEYAEDLTHGQFYDLTNTELMELFNSELNTSFTTGDDMLDMLLEEARNLAMKDLAEEWDDMDEDEQEELVFDYMDFVEVLPTKQDKVQFVALAVELVAQDMTEG
ncbi:hypothetical protein HOS99_gp129 [Staphylococcus phage phiSA_BS1]|uniref:DUF7222 domain-containing protein n=2 Tax=Baoshanvirus TaxID=2732969 RepID=A0A2P1MXR5_9CAUD|nr:hypothetical protein HOS99_gp129 [Staphylococcus phage phiSA_BS1]YP_009799845.1 hypothetical protein HOT02_gp004 [Staphylococcus phage phiSA_BS2]AVP40370.1 hypothetical protein [Staphylococcus phage phiSA_BS1]AVR55449.1 hypothetical protein phiSABS2_4 [Staphylococcus phage phiSA_BS2]